jgi:hypothetical protein
VPDQNPIVPQPTPPLIARLRPVRCGGTVCYAVIDARGMVLAVAADHALARTVARLLGFEPVSVH